MGCCSPNDKTLVDFPFHKIEELNNLKLEVSEIISDKNHRQRKNINKLFELFDKTSIKINEFEKEVQLLKNKKRRNLNSNISDDMIRGIANDIKQLKDYNHTLNDLLKESDDNEVANNNTYNNNFYGIKTQKNDENLRNKKNNFENDFQYNDDFQNESGNNFQNDFNGNINTGNEILNTQNEFQNIYNIDNNTGLNTGNNSDEEDSEKEQKVYFKKSIRRNKKGAMLNKKINSKKDLQPGEYSQSQEIQDFNNFKENFQNGNENINENGNENGNKKINENGNENLNENNNENENLNNLIDEDNAINLTFIIENGNKIDVQTGKDENLLDVVDKVLENVEGNIKLENILIFDGEEDITDKVKNGEIISTFGFNDEHIIQIKFKD